MHLKEIQKLVKESLDNDKVTVDDISRAHLEEISDQVTKALEAHVTSGDF